MRKLKLNRVFSYFLLLLTASLPLHSAASSDGQLCDGPAILLCIPAAIVGSLAESLTPDPPARKLFKSVEDGNLPGLKSSLAQYPQVLTTAQLLADAVHQYAYISNPQSQIDDALSAKRLAVIQYLLENRPKIPQEKLNAILAGQFAETSNDEPRLIEVGKVLIAHGASFADLNLSDYAGTSITTKTQLAFIAANGANLKLIGRNGYPPVLSYLIYNHPEYAEVLLQHGANPNMPRSPYEPSGLVTFARHCVRPPSQYSNNEVNARLQQACELQTAAQMDLLMRYGADVNGLADPNTTCTTPYLAAKAAGNQPLLEKLIALGADTKRCTTDSLWK